MSEPKRESTPYTTVEVTEEVTIYEDGRRGPPLYLHFGGATAKLTQPFKAEIDITSCMDSTLHVTVKRKGKPARLFEVNIHNLCKAIVEKMEKEE